MTTNQAFIKAYRQDAAQSSVPRSATADLARHTATPTTAALGTSIAYVSAEVGNFSSTVDTTIPVPHSQGQGEGSTRHSPTRPSQQSSYIAPAKRIDPATGGKRPLSSFTSDRRSPQESTTKLVATPTRPILRPGTTIASFRWPALCRTLCRQAGDDFDRVADVLVNLSDERRSVIGVLGLFPKRGCTTNLLCLASRLSARERRTIIVDGNLATPELASLLDAKPIIWWQDVIERSAAVADAVVRANDDCLDLLAAGPRSSDPLRLAGSAQVSATASMLRSVYELVLVDLGAFFDPTLQPIALELVSNMRVDAVVGVTGPGAPDRRDLATIAEYLNRTGCEFLGTIQNRMAPATAT